MLQLLPYAKNVTQYNLTLWQQTTSINKQILSKHSATVFTLLL